MAKLTVLSGPDRGLSYDVNQEAILGRASTNSVPLNDTKASRQNCRVYWENNLYYIEDMKSRNGTLVNGKKINSQKLYSGDRIKIGTTILMFVVEEEDPGETVDISELVSQHAATPPPPPTAKPISPPKTTVKSRPKKANASLGQTGRHTLSNKASLRQTSRHRMRRAQPNIFTGDSPTAIKVLAAFALFFFMIIVTYISRWITLQILN